MLYFNVFPERIQRNVAFLILSITNKLKLIASKTQTDETSSFRWLAIFSHFSTIKD